MPVWYRHPACKPTRPNGQANPHGGFASKRRESGKIAYSKAASHRSGRTFIALCQFVFRRRNA
ncbi:hypothetical protein BSIN_3905 [Burkholderia singularis]|uniref:Uncharacterized protein n=1 Tax=Burkholderia singularis TaxID=1503053 RepID=A0A238H6Q0_9BURK|nr:hypothetical protein BSIN_3905 [Burkholderia singularis]